MWQMNSGEPKIGQQYRKSCVFCWKMMPIFQGNTGDAPTQARVPARDPSGAPRRLNRPQKEAKWSPQTSQREPKAGQSCPRGGHMRESKGRKYTVMSILFTEQILSKQFTMDRFDLGPVCWAWARLGPGLGSVWVQLGPGLGPACARFGPAWARLGWGLDSAWARLGFGLGPA